MGQASKAVPAFIAGDWGTTHLRLFLCDAAGNALESLEGPGVAAVASGASDASGALARVEFARQFLTLAQDWTTRFGRLPALLCGMIGSDIGWMSAPYVECPARPGDLLDACVAVEGAHAHIVPGMRCRNRLGGPDVLRGEETQILGAMRLDGALAHGRHLLCLPGTHTKWVQLQDGSVQEFLTAPTGELFALLRERSVLVRNEAPAEEFLGSPSFALGIRRVREHPQASLLHLMFESRSRRLVDAQGMDNAAAFLSGLLIGADVQGALAMFDFSGSVVVIGSATLTRLYEAALSSQGVGSKGIDGSAAALAGLAQVHAHFTLRSAQHVA
jgi:2-dehydro-3-deoxygalactonokinase